MFGKLGIWELVIILVIVLVIFGPKKLPGLGSAVGKTIKEFKTSISDPAAKKAAKEKEEAEALEATRVEVIEMSEEGS